MMECDSNEVFYATSPKRYSGPPALVRAEPIRSQNVEQVTMTKRGQRQRRRHSDVATNTTRNEYKVSEEKASIMDYDDDHRRKRTKSKLLRYKQKEVAKMEHGLRSILQLDLDDYQVQHGNHTYGIHDVLKCVFQCMKLYQGVRSIQHLSLSILNKIPPRFVLGQHFISARFCLATMRNFPHQEGIQKVGCHFLDSLLCSAGNEGFRIFNQEGGIEAIFGVLKLPKISKDIVKCCKNILNEIAKVANGHFDMRKDGKYWSSDGLYADLVRFRLNHVEDIR